MKRIQVIACAAPPVLHLQGLIQHLKSNGFTVSVVFTPVASTWLDTDAFGQSYGVPVRVEPRLPTEPRSNEEQPEAIFVAPATFNTINKWAAGIADTLALSVLCESLGRGVPIYVLGCMKDSLRRHPAFAANRLRLESAGVVFIDTERLALRGSDGLLRFSWEKIDVTKLA